MMMMAAQPSLVSIEATIPLFTGADPTYPAARWVEEISDNAEVFGWSPSQKLLMARRALTGVAGLWLRSEKMFKSFDELQRALLEEFPYDANPKVIHELMTNRKKKHDESCYEYMLVMKELGKRGGFEDYVAIQYIVDGIEDCVIHKVMLYGVSTYPDLKEKLKIYEYMKRKMAVSAKEETRGERLTDVSVKQDPDQRQSSGHRCQSEMSAKQPSIMFEVRMDEATNMSNDYSKETEVTGIDTKTSSISCQTEVVHFVNKKVLENKKEELFKEAPIELKSIKEENIVEHKVEEVSETKIVEEQVEKVEEKVEKVVKKGEFPSLVKEKDGLTRRYIDNKKVYKRCVEKDRKYQDGLMENEICCKTNEEKIMEKEIAKWVYKDGNFSERIIKEERKKDYHVLR
ncbi:uncharacterized protein LOC125489551 [Plutella xylostella]|uniref:uncharacterized protein LOC125489551 n=1 Tax=Plutella xylostella TaxID=51655 RepID=UPI0020328396|nr:uncharacterized protein LOC125489551 [Plutella xylostella]